MKIKDAIGEVISRNAEISILRKSKKPGFSDIIWTGPAHQVPQEYLGREFKPISDYINYDTTKVSHPIHLELKEEFPCDTCSSNKEYLEGGECHCSKLEL